MKIKILLLAIGFFSIISMANAQENQLPPGPSISLPKEVAGTVNCFDYYKFQSVKVDVEPTVNSTVSGVPLTFKATIKNENDYPIVAGAVYAKVFKKQTNQDKAHANGNYLVDQFFVQENISLNAKEEKPIEFVWKVPTYAVTGDYQIAMYFTSAKKFNLLGLSFTDDVTGNIADFSIIGEITKNIEFNKNTVDINGTNYHFAAYPPRFNDEDIVVKTELINSTQEIQSIPITWKLYSWDGQSEDNLVNNKEEIIQLKPNETKQISYTINQKEAPVYYLVAEAKYKDTKSILDIRTVRGEVNKVRINFPSITSYPLKKEEKNTLFVCAHNSGTADVVDNNKLIVTILDENQKEIHKYTHEGQISGAMMGLKDEFIPKETFATFYIKSELYTDNKLIDQATMKYDCNELNKDLCPIKNSITDNLTKERLQSKSVLGIIFLIIVFAVIVVTVMKNNKPGINLLILGIVSSAVMFGGVGKVEAKSVVWNTSSVPFLCYYWSQFGSGWSGGLTGTNVSVIYNAQVFNMSTGGSVVSDGMSLPVGTQLYFSNTNFVDTDISWFGTGGSNDSPYGTWLAGATAPGNPWLYYVGNAAFGVVLGANIYIPLSVHPPDVYVNHAGSTAGLSCDGSGKYCTVTSVGNIRLNINFSNTSGRFYYAYIGGGYTDYNGVPMRSGSANGFNMCSGKGSGAGSSLSGSDYILPVPAQAITYNLTAFSPSMPPSVPTLTGPTLGFINTNYNFTANATDPEGNNIRYGFDWDNNNTVDQLIPATGFLSSGTNGIAGRQWAVIGSKTLKVNACDSNGSCSGWSAPHTINIIDLMVTLTPTLPANINNINNGTMTPGTANVNLAWTIANEAQVCASGCECSFVEGGAFTGFNPYPATNSASKPIVKGNNNFEIYCRNTEGAHDNALATVLATCSVQTGPPACDKPCGPGNTVTPTLNNNCSITNSSVPGCPGNPNCPASTSFEEVRP